MSAVTKTASDVLGAATGSLQQLQARLKEAKDRGELEEASAADFQRQISERLRLARGSAKIDTTIPILTQHRDAALQAEADAKEEAENLRSAIAVLKTGLPPLELGALQDELAEAVATATGVARNYAECIRRTVDATVEFRAAQVRINQLRDQIEKRKGTPAHTLRANMILPPDIAWAFNVAVDNYQDQAVVQRATASMFERWSI